MEKKESIDSTMGRSDNDGSYDDIYGVNYWARIPGALAFAILPQPSSSSLSSSSSSSSVQSSPSSLSSTSSMTDSQRSTCITPSNSGDKIEATESYFWPAILYPSWSYAAKESGLILGAAGGGGHCQEQSRTSSINKSNDNIKIGFMGCKTSVTVDQMGRNLVPKSVALGQSSIPGQRSRPKVVAYFLGFGCSISSNNNTNRKSSWSAVNVKDVRQYNVANCKQVLKSYSNSNSKSIHHAEQQERLWQYENLILAMEEAAIVLERRREFNPKNWTKELAMVPTKGATVEPGCNLKNQEVITTNKKAKVTNGIKQSHNDDNPVIEQDLTPECFNDWRLGGNTQKRGDSQSQFQFTPGTAT